jgi:CheY-like chemotaxis protein
MQRTGTILIADDDRNDVSIVSHALVEAGLKNPVRWLRDGGTAVRYLSQSHIPQEMPLLLLMDWNIPGTNAAELLKWIRQRPHYLNLLVIVLTGSEDPIQKRLAYEAGANWHFVKSADCGDVVRLVRRIQEFWGSDVPTATSVKLSNRRVE